MIAITNVIDVSVSVAPVGLGAFNVNNVGLFTTDQFLSNDDDDEYRVYVSPQAVGEDFGTNTETYDQAIAFFSQTPNVLNGGGALIIFPAENASNGVISGITVQAAGSGYHVNDVLTIAGGTGGTAKVLVISGTGQVLQIALLTGGSAYSTGTGAATTVAPSGGTGCTINITSVENIETLGDAIIRVKDLIFFCGIISTFLPSGSDRKTLADEIQSYGNKIWLLPSATEADIAGVFTDIKNAADYATRCLYYSTAALDSRLFAAAYAGRGFSVNFQASNGTLTMNLKQLATIDPDEGITQTLYSQCKTAGVDIYPSFGGVPDVASMGANKFFDQVYNLIWFVTSIQVAGYNALAQVSGKIPQTEPGMTVLKSAYRSVCELAVNNAYVAPGTWTSPETFGNQQDMLGNIIQRGFYIYSAPVSQQSKAAREVRTAPVVQIAIKEAGAIQESSVIVYINP